MFIKQISAAGSLTTAVVLSLVSPANAISELNPAPYTDEIARAVSMQIMEPGDVANDRAPLTRGMLIKAVTKAQGYLPEQTRSLLSVAPVESSGSQPLTRLDAITMVIQGLVPDSRINPQLSTNGQPVVDPDVQTVSYLLQYDYINTYKDVAGLSLNLSQQLTIGAAAYKGMLPNLDDEPGQLRLTAPATVGYAANLLARAVRRPEEYTGVI